MAAQQTPKDEKIAEVGNTIRQKREITKEMASKDRKPVHKVKIRCGRNRANLALTYKQGHYFNITEINNVRYATAWPSLTWYTESLKARGPKQT